MNSDTLIETLLALPADERERMALELWLSVHGPLDRAAAKDLVDRLSQRSARDPEPAPQRKAVHRSVFGPSAIDLDQRALDQRCVRYGHLDRSITHCANPRCPSTDPSSWTEYRKLRELDRPGSTDER